MKTHKINVSRYMLAFALTIIVFLIGYFVGNTISNIKLDNLSYLEQDIRVDSLSNELVFALAQAELCNDISSSSYTKELADIGKRLVYMESLYGYNSQEVIRLKNYYSLLQIRHWMLFTEMNKKCGYNTSLVLYFYTNYGCNDCTDQGLVLTNIYRSRPFFNIYSFEYAINNSATNYLQTVYNISKDRLPTLVINGDVYYGFQSKDVLNDRLNLNKLLADDKLKHPEKYS